LSEIDPQNGDTYKANAQKYRDELVELDNWVLEETASVPEDNRKIVTDHLVFAYFCNAYDFQQVGAIIPGFSTVAEPSARELAQLESAINDLGVNAIFVGNTVNPGLAQRVAEDTGVQLVLLYTGSLSEPGGPADSYLKYMRYNTRAIVDALS